MNNATRLLVLVALVALLGIIALSDNKPDPIAKHTYIEQEQTERIWFDHYDASGTLKKVVQTIDRIPFPAVESAKTGTGFASFAPSSDIIINNTSVLEGILYLHSKFAKKKIESGHLSVLDRYDVQTGSYINSTRLPFAARHAVVYSERLYCSHDTTITVLRFEG